MPRILFCWRVTARQRGIQSPQNFSSTTATIDNDDKHDNNNDNEDRSPHPRQQKPPSKMTEAPFRPSSLSLHLIVVCRVMTSPSDDLLGSQRQHCCGGGQVYAPPCCAPVVDLALPYLLRLHCGDSSVALPPSGEVNCPLSPSHLPGGATAVKAAAKKDRPVGTIWILPMMSHLASPAEVSSL
jgi:hypothetical protein